MILQVGVRRSLSLVQASKYFTIEGREKAPLRWLLVGIIAVGCGINLHNTNNLEPAGLWYLLGFAALAAFLGDWAVRLGRNRHKKPDHRDDFTPLLQVLRDYGVDELGGLYLYLPVPERPEDHEARTWFRVLRAKEMVVSGPWRVDADRTPPWLRKTHPRLWSDKVGYYDVYRLRKDVISSLF